MFENKKIIILGMARSGYEAAKVLVKRNNEVILNDKNTNQDINHVDELLSLGVNVILGEHPLNIIDNSIDYVIKNPGIKDDNVIVSRAIELNIPVINEVEMCYNLLPKNVTIIGITGSNGKTTTTSLTYEILKNAKLPVKLAGNIGFPLSSIIEDIKENDVLLMEISIQQLCNFKNFKTNISVLTNIFDAHLDFVGSKENYINIKKRIFNNHTNNDYAILNLDNNDVVNNTNDIMSHKEYFSINNKSAICHLENNNIIYNNKILINTNDIILKGNHNYENIMASIMIAKRLNISDDIIIDTIKNFKGVEHRIEFVKEINGIKIYNDSKATNVKATEIALSSFNNKTILLLGGLDRGHSFNDLTKYMTNVKLIVSFGETKNRIKEYADSINIKCIVTETLDSAVKISYENAIKDDIILLSPACASWDQFNSFEERGTLFKEYVNKL